MLALAALAVALAVMAASRIAYIRLVSTAESVLLGLRLRAFEHIHRLSLASHAESRRGVLVARVTSDVETLAQFTQWGAIAWVVNTALITATLTAMFVYSWQLTLLAVAVHLPLAPFLRWGAAPPVHRLRQRARSGGRHHGPHERSGGRGGGDPRLRLRRARAPAARPGRRPPVPLPARRPPVVHHHDADSRSGVVAVAVGGGGGRRLAGRGAEPQRRRAGGLRVPRSHAAEPHRPAGRGSRSDPDGPGGLVEDPQSARRARRSGGALSFG